MTEMTAQQVLFSGCAHERGGQPVRHATIALAKKLGIELWEAPDKGCCGARADRKVGDDARRERFGPLVDGLQQGLDILCLSPACDRVVAAYMAQNAGETTSARIRDVATFLAQATASGQLPHAIDNPLTGLRVALHTTCHGDHNPPHLDGAGGSGGLGRLLGRIRPGSKNQDQQAGKVQEPAAFVSDPALGDIVAVTDADKLDDVSVPGRCASYPLLAGRVSRVLGVPQAAPCLALAAHAKADVLVTPCFLCFMGLNQYQRGLEQGNPARDVPVLHLAQLVGVACSLPALRLDLQRTTVSARRVLMPFVTYV